MTSYLNGYRIDLCSVGKEEKGISVNLMEPPQRLRLLQLDIRSHLPDYDCCEPLDWTQDSDLPHVDINVV